jgi:hypothetical protein
MVCETRVTHHRLHRLLVLCHRSHRVNLQAGKGREGQWKYGARLKAMNIHKEYLEVWLFCTRKWDGIPACN